MKNLPDIDPEVRGLLEEIVADPRSSIRLVPHKPLKSWFDSGETASAREVSGTKAERHLIEAHREALAQLLCDAAWIACWKEPVLAHKPTGPDGIPFDPTSLEPSWNLRANRRLKSTEVMESVELVRQCLTGLRSEHALPLARSSLSLVSSDRARFYAAVAIPWNRPRTAVSLFSRLSARVCSGLRSSALVGMAARMCSIDRFGDARATYLAASRLRPESPSARICVFNLSCFMGDAATAIQEARELGGLSGRNAWRILEARDLLRSWAQTRGEEELRVARRTASLVQSKIPESLHPILEAYES